MFKEFIQVKSFAIVFALFAFASSCTGVQQRSRASEMIRLIEDYREQENELPLFLPEMENSNIHYRLESDTTNTIWYPTGPGEINLYDSRTGEWKIEESEI